MSYFNGWEGFDDGEEYGKQDQIAGIYTDKPGDMSSRMDLSFFLFFLCIPKICRHPLHLLLGPFFIYIFLFQTHLSTSVPAGFVGEEKVKPFTGAYTNSYLFHAKSLWLRIGRSEMILAKNSDTLLSLFYLLKYSFSFLTLLCFFTLFKPYVLSFLDLSFAFACLLYFFSFFFFFKPLLPL